MSRARRWAGALCVLAALAAGCGSDEIKPTPLKDFKPTATIRKTWSTSLGDAGPYSFTPVLYEGSLFAASHRGELVRLNPANGKQIWRVDTGQRLAGGVGAGLDMVLVGTDKGEVLAYGLNGKLRWKGQVTSEVLAPPQAAEGIVVVRSGDGHVFGLDAANGQRKWEYQVPLPALLLHAPSGVTLSGSLAILGMPAGRMVALNITTGAAVWDTLVAQPRGDNELERITDIGASPIVDGDQACAAAFQGRIACVDVNKGTLTWGRDASSADALGIDPITLYLTDANGTVIAFEKQSGASLWKQDKLLNRNVSGPVALGDFVVVGDYDGYVHVLNFEDGAFVARTTTDGSQVLGRPLVVGKDVIVQTRSGGLYAFSIKKG